MASYRLQSFVAGLALLLTTAACCAPQARDNSKPPHAETTYVKVTYRVFITDAGAPEKFEFVSIEPPVGSSVEEELKESVLKAVRAWTFTPMKEHGKAVAGWAVVPFMIDLANPIAVVGGT